MALSVSINGGEEGYFPIDAELYQLLVTGNVSEFDQLDGLIKLRCARDRSTVLHIAASFGQVDLVNLILDQCPELMVMGNSFGDVPVHSAIKTGRLNTTAQAMINWLKENNNQIEIGQVLGVVNEEGNTPLHCSLEFYDVEDYQTVVDLVELYPGAAYATNKQGICPLFLAIKRELCPLVKRMLDLMQPFKEDAFKCLMEGRSVLHAAVAATTSELLEHMLCYNVKLTNLMHDGWSALSYAASMNHLEKVEILIRYDPSSTFISNEDKTFPIHVAVLGGHTRIVDLLTSSRFLLNAKGQNIFHLAALSGDSHMVSHLILNLSDVKFLVNQKDVDGNTPLHLATRDQQIEVVEILIQNENVNGGLANKQGLTACDLAKNKLTALDNADKEMVPRLNFMFKRVANGLQCSISPIDEDLYRYLLLNDMRQVNETISAKGIQLKDLGCPTNGDTILHILASIEKHQLLEQVLHPDCGCGDLREQPNNNGDLPIHLAAKAGNLKTVQALFIWSHNREVNTRICLKQNMEGDTALHVAVQNNHRDVAKYLYNYCPDAAYYLNKNKISPLLLAIKNCYNEIDMVDLMIPGLQNNMQFIKTDSMGMKSIIHVAIETRKIGECLMLINN
ncbi:unnamed protein product [Amaranthus hypochondriacus]